MEEYMEKLILDLSRQFFVKHLSKNRISVITSKNVISDEILQKYPVLELEYEYVESRAFNQFDFILP